MESISPNQWAGIATALMIGVAAIVGAVIRPVLDNLRGTQRRSCHLDETASAQLRDLHVWHGPDHHGEQGWRGAGIERAIELLTDGQREHTELLRELVEIAKRG